MKFNINSIIDIYFLVEAGISSFWSQLWPTFLGTMGGFSGAYFIYWRNRNNEIRKAKEKQESIFNSYVYIIEHISNEFKELNTTRFSASSS